MPKVTTFLNNPLTLSQWIQGGGRVYEVLDGHNRTVAYVRSYDRKYASATAKRYGMKLGRMMKSVRAATRLAAMVREIPVSNPRYGKRAGAFVAAEMRSMRRGSRRVRSPAQAVVVGLARARRAGVRVPRKNPPAVPVAYVLSDRALEIAYTHAADGKDYQHTFRKGVRIQLLRDGSARLYRPDGRPVWKLFHDRD